MLINNKILPVTPHIQGILENAKTTAISLNRRGVDIDLFFCSFIINADTSLQTIFRASNINLYELGEFCLSRLTEGKSKHPSGTILPCVNKLFIIADDICKTEMDVDYISSESLMLSFLHSEVAPKTLREFFGADGENIFDNSQLNTLLGTCILFSKEYPVADSEDEEDSEDEDEEDEYLDMFSENQILSEFADNLNILAAEGKFDKIIDFDNKIDELATILCRKKKPNAILVGPAGTGKTSLVEGLASKIINGEAPELLSNRVIYSLNLSSMIAGTQYRGQFEERLEKFIEEAKRYKNLILFIDEIHTLVGAGGTSNNSLEASNILKPELARGTLSCIGATTINEYTNTIKKDSALDRRFERVVVKEPSKFQMAMVLPQIISHYEEFHGVTYSKEFTDRVIEFCERFIPNKFYPDKAIDIIDHCGAQAKVNFWEIDDSIRNQQQLMLQIVREKGSVEEGMMLDLNEKILEWEKKLLDSEAVVDVSHLKDFFAKRLNAFDKKENILSLSNNLSSKIVGQKVSIKKLIDSLIISNFGLDKVDSYSKPDSFLIFGNKSTGKTLFCESLKENAERIGANVLYYNGVEFSDRMSSYKILSDVSNNTTLCERVCIHPNSIIIFDDFELVHDSCINLFSQILKEGRIQMNNGDIADFSNCKIFITCSSFKTTELGFGAMSNNNPIPNINPNITKLIKEKIVFTALNSRGLRRVFYYKLKEIQGSLALQDIKLTFSFKFIKKFIQDNCSNENSVIELNDVIKSKLIPQISSQILTQNHEIKLS